MARNFRAIPGLKVVSRELTAPYASARTDADRLHRELGATRVLDITVKTAAPSVEVVARLREPGRAAPAWERTIGGDLVVVERRLLEDLDDALARGGAVAKPRSSAETGMLTKLPTARADAAMAYVQVARVAR